MSDFEDDDFMHDDDNYEFEYEYDGEDEDPDADLENKYYNAKGMELDLKDE